MDAALIGEPKSPMNVKGERDPAGREQSTTVDGRQASSPATPTAVNPHDQSAIIKIREEFSLGALGQLLVAQRKVDRRLHVGKLNFERKMQRLFRAQRS